MSPGSSRYSLILGDLQHSCGVYAECCKVVDNLKKHKVAHLQEDLHLEQTVHCIHFSVQRHSHPLEGVWDTLFGISGGLSGWYKNVCSACDPCNPFNACQLRSCSGAYPKTLDDAQLCSWGNVRCVAELLCCVSCADVLLLLTACWSNPAACEITCSLCRCNLMPL